jgi:TetR/AcrR family transcriptional regulator
VKSVVCLKKRGEDMPKNTFFNLSDEKQEKIYGAAVKEFSSKRFSEASINMIVKTAGIPRGSFYQYFDGKEDIYAYIKEEIAKEQAVVMRFLARSQDVAGAFEELKFQAKAALELYRVRPEYRRIALLAEKDDSGFIEGLRASQAEDTEHIKELLMREQLRGHIKPDIDSGLIAGIAYSQIMKEVLKEGQDKDTSLKRIDGIIRAIQEGIMVHGIA